MFPYLTIKKSFLHMAKRENHVKPGRVRGWRVKRAGSDCRRPLVAYWQALWQCYKEPEPPQGLPDCYTLLIPYAIVLMLTLAT